MSFPANDMVKCLYRNRASDVSRFLEKNHPNFWIYNLSNNDIDEVLFKKRVNSYPWEDHHSPSLLVLFQMCDHIYDFLLKDERNVAVLHCNAGKGRTGTAISCFLLYSCLADNFLNAIIFYGHKRFRNGRGVTQPAQQRYIQYFEMAFKREVQSPSRKRLKLIKLKTIPKNTGNMVEACVEIYDGKDYTPIWTDNPNFKFEKYGMKRPHHFPPQTPVDARTDTETSILVSGPNDRGLELSGDVFFRIVNVKNGQLICRFALNTAFMMPRV